MPDFDEIMKMAANAQAELQKAQDTLDTIEVEGQSGGGLVKIRATAKGRILAVAIDESLLQPSEKTMVEDLIAAAINDARGNNVLSTPGVAFQMGGEIGELAIDHNTIDQGYTLISLFSGFSGGVSEFKKIAAQLGQILRQ